MVWMIVLLAVNAAGTVCVALREACRPIRALTWTLICLLLPILGALVYVLLSLPMKAKRPKFPHEAATHSALSGKAFASSVTALAAAVQRMTGASPVRGQVQILTDGRQTYDALFHAIRNAHVTLDVEYYIYRDDHIGHRFTDLLIERAEAGVQVRFLRDGWGSRTFPRREIKRLANAGVVCRTFFPVRFPWLGPRLNHRDHCKIVVVDGHTAFVGGINVGDEYTGHKRGVGPWRDTHLSVEGDAVRQIRDVFLMNWRIATPDGTRTAKKRRSTQKQHRLSRVAIGEWAAELDLAGDIAVSPVPDVYLQTVESGPDRPAQAMRTLFFLCLTLARKNVDITTPYFVPDSDITMALKTAVMRGVRVRLLVPLHPDHKLIGFASQTYYAELLEAGVHIYQYHAGTLHAKVMTVDGECAVIGAANYDLRSFRLNFETSTVVYDRRVVDQLTMQLEHDLEQSIRLHETALRGEPLWKQVAERGARLLSPLL